MKCVMIVTLFFIILFSVHAQTYFYTGNSALALKNEEGVSYIHHDRLGTDIRTKSLPFGQTLEGEERFGYTGKEQDNSGLHYFSARYLDTNLGRFTSVDPVPSQKPYQYVENSPLLFTDPTGKRVFQENWDDKSIIVSYNDQSQEKYVELGLLDIYQIPNNLYRLGITNIKELIIPDSSFDSSGKAAVGFKVYGDTQRDKNRISGSDFGKKIRAYLNPDARIIIGQGEVKELSNPSEFINGIIAENPGMSVTLFPPGVNNVNVGPQGATLNRFKNSDRLYSQTLISTVDEWTNFLKMAGAIVQITIPMQNNQARIVSYTNLFIHDEIQYDRRGARITPGTTSRYTNLLQPEYLKTFLEDEDIQVFGLMPTENLQDATATHITTHLQSTIQRKN